MAVAATNQVDVSTLIAESIDGYYLRLEEDREFLRKLAERKTHFAMLVEHGHFYTTEFGTQDPRGHRSGNNKDYRAGYKTGWAHAHRNPGEAPKSEQELTAAGKSQDYTHGYEAGHGKSKAGQQISELVKSGQPREADELAAKHFTGPHYQDHAQLDGESPDRWVGAEKDPQQHQIKKWDGASRSLLHTMKAIGWANAALDVPDEHGLDLHNKSFPGKGRIGQEQYEAGSKHLHHPKYAPHPADIGEALGNQFGAMIGRAGGAKEWMARDVVKNADDIIQGGGGGGGGDDGNDGLGGLGGGGNVDDREGGEAAVQRHARQQKQKQRRYDNHIFNLTSDAFGAQAFQNHEDLMNSLPPEQQQALRDGTAEHEHFHSGIDSFHNAHHDPEAGQGSASEVAHKMHEATKAAHDSWVNSLVSWAQKQQSDSTQPFHDLFSHQPAVLEQKDPNDPFGRRVLVKTDGTFADRNFKYNYRNKDHVAAHQQSTFNPVDFLGHALRDPMGWTREGALGNIKAGWKMKAANQLPGFEHAITGEVRSHQVAEGFGIYDQVRADPEFQQMEGEKDSAYRKRWIKEGKIRAEAHPEWEEVRADKYLKAPGGFSWDRFSTNLRKALHQARGEGGELLAHSHDVGGFGDDKKKLKGHPAHDRGPDGQLSNIGKNTDHPMWHHHYGLADINNSEMSPEEHNPYWAAKKRKIKGKGKGHGKYEWTYVRSTRIVEAIDFMIDTFEGWIRKHLDIHEGHMPTIREELYSTVRPMYGHLFEVENC